jgi:hypothetical protein
VREIVSKISLSGGQGFVHCQCKKGNCKSGRCYENNFKSEEMKSNNQKLKKHNIQHA